jgi:hypothetical protein
LIELGFDQAERRLMPRTMPTAEVEGMIGFGMLEIRRSSIG